MAEWTIRVCRRCEHPHQTSGVIACEGDEEREVVVVPRAELEEAKKRLRESEAERKHWREQVFELEEVKRALRLIAGYTDADTMGYDWNAAEEIARAALAGSEEPKLNVARTLDDTCGHCGAAPGQPCVAYRTLKGWEPIKLTHIHANPALAGSPPEEEPNG